MRKRRLIRTVLGLLFVASGVGVVATTGSRPRIPEQHPNPTDPPTVRPGWRAMTAVECVENKDEPAVRDQCWESNPVPSTAGSPPGSGSWEPGEPGKPSKPAWVLDCYAHERHVERDLRQCVVAEDGTPLVKVTIG